MEIQTKYHRTYHLPFSEGLQNDDRRVEDGWEILFDNELVLTEKLDGENNSIANYGVFARSHGAPTTNPWTRNLWGDGGLYDQVKSWLDDDVMIYGENLYGIHSIEYNKLKNFYFMFGVRDKDYYYSWDEVEEFSKLLKLAHIDIPTVPVLYRGKVKDSKELESLINTFMSKGSAFGDTIEGVVVRNANNFNWNDFNKNVVKYVRKNHVQTDQFWQKNWKKAELKW